MKAQVLNHYGDAKAFELQDVPIPDPESGQVQVRVQAIGINLMDVKIRSGALKDQMPTKFPAVLGSDFAGTVSAIGDRVGGLEVGDRVAGLADSGAYAEYALARADMLAPLPPTLDFQRAATVPTAAETSGRMIGIIKPQNGETAVVNGAAGSVGSILVQLLMRDGVKVIGTASEDNHEFLTSLGVTPTTYGDGVADRIRDLASNGVDAVFDVTDHGFMDAAIELRGGTARIVTISDFAASQRGVTVSYGDQSKIHADNFMPVLDLAASGDIETEIAKVFAFDDIAAAQQFSEAGHLRGKIVVTGP